VAKFNKHPQGLSLTFFDGFEFQDVGFVTNQVSPNLDFIWSFKSSVKTQGVKTAQQGQIVLGFVYLFS